MRLVRQRENIDCGVAALAMMLNKRYETIARDYPDLRANGLHVEIAKSILTIETLHWWYVTEPRFVWRARGKQQEPTLRNVLNSWSDGMDWPMMLLVQRPSITMSHWIIIDGGKDGIILDPALEARRPVEDAPHLDWRVVRYLMKGFKLKTLNDAA